MNKNALLGFNIVLLILIGVLFYMQFSSGPQKSATTATTTTSDAAPAGISLAYFEMDSIENNYEYLKDVRNELRAKEQQLTTQLNGMKKNYFDKVNKFQQEATTMSQERQGAMQQDLMQEQKVIQGKEQSMGADLQDASFKKMQDVNKKIEEYLKEYNKGKGYSYILAHQPGTIYYKDTTFDITGALLKGLNKSYKKK
jgi:outer membrane protein